MQNVQTLIAAFGGTINIVIKLGVAAGLLVFLWGLTMFIFKSGDPQSHTEGRNRMVWGIIALFVMLSVWGLVDFINISVFGHGLEHTDPNAMYGNNV